MSLAEIIKSDVVNQLKWDGRVDASKINVTVDGSTVKLSGTVPTTTARIAAVDDTLNVKGVTRVDDEIEVELDEPHHSTDEAIKDFVENTLTWNSNLNAFNIDVTVNKSWVTLEGTVDALWKRFLAEEEVQNIVGVVGVTNKLAVADHLDLTDKKIAQDVVEALDRDSRVLPDQVNVQVNDGKVKLSGKVRNYSTKAAAFKAAIRTPGVQKVKNNLMVEY